MISGGLTQSLPLKYFYAGPMFRYERPQKGRMRQFHQVGIEYLGPDDALADAEILLVAHGFWHRLACLMIVNFISIRLVMATVVRPTVRP